MKSINLNLNLVKELYGGNFDDNKISHTRVKVGKLQAQPNELNVFVVLSDFGNGSKKIHISMCYVKATLTSIINTCLYTKLFLDENNWPVKGDNESRATVLNEIVKIFKSERVAEFVGLDGNPFILNLSTEKFT